MNFTPGHIFGTSFTTFAVDASGKGVGAVFTWPFLSDNLTHLGYSTSAASSPVGFTATAQGVDTTNRVPNGTDIGTPAATTPTAGTFTWVSLGSLVVAQYALVSGAVLYGSSGSATFNNNSNGGGGLIYPYGATRTASTWSRVGGAPCIALKSASGKIVTGSIPASAVTTTNLNSSERANVFTPTFACYMTGASAFLNAASAAALSLHLYTGTSTTPTATGKIAKSIGAGANGWVNVQFDTPILLAANTAYRVSLAETSGNNAGSYHYSFASQADMQYLMGTSMFTGSDNRTSGAWAGTTTTDCEMIWPMLSSVPVSGGGPLIGPGRLVR